MTPAVALAAAERTTSWALCGGIDGHGLAVTAAAMLPASATAARAAPRLSVAPCAQLVELAAVQSVEAERGPEAMGGSSGRPGAGEAVVGAALSNDGESGSRTKRSGGADGAASGAKSESEEP